ncbi:msl3868 [Mesorhizobium japonicum MAFF 303099]|uniref:Msl3868 protein n=1 Tax=Mesorhizobium japonicum (strain LMG 29417 / CECT 9101 / MAFF 303099) TaxID=266835 RepID=Q98FA2_RHILO|nr:msl3868 [Mesorhizobium japonicum MAFF 303099]
MPDAIFADRLRGSLANPLNLIRFVPAEGLDVSDSPAPQFLFNSNEGGADAHAFIRSCLDDGRGAVRAGLGQGQAHRLHL